MGCGAFSKQTSNISDTPTISRHALGRIAQLGDLYDATTDQFCGMSIFQDPLPPDCPAKTKTDNPHSDNRSIKVRSLEEKFHELSVTGELKLSVLAGMCELGGYAKYFNQGKDRFESEKTMQIFNFKTVTEHLEINQVKQYRPISPEAMIHGGATHVVTEIEWGANGIITARVQNRTIEKKNEAQGGFVGRLKSFFGIKSTGSNTKQETKENEDVAVDIFGDIFPDELPQSLNGAMELARNVPQLIKETNDGKGKPLRYTMCSISHPVLKIPSQRLKTFISVDDDRASKMVGLFDHITDLRQKVHDQSTQLHNESEREDARRREARLKDHEATVKRELATLLKGVRSGGKGVECLDAFCDEHRQAAEEKFRE